MKPHGEDACMIASPDETRARQPTSRTDVITVE
jgi:hypothetical protein